MSAMSQIGPGACNPDLQQHLQPQGQQRARVPDYQEQKGEQAQQTQQAYQESPGRQALIQLAQLNKFLDSLNTAVKCLSTLEGDHQALALETMARLFRLDKGIRA